MEAIKKATNGRNLKEGQWEDTKQWSLGVGKRRKSFKTGDDDDYLFVFSVKAPQWARASSFTRFLDHTQDTQQSVGLLWTSNQPVAETST
jgi:hypothetical protein